MKKGEEWWIRDNRELEKLIDGEDIMRFIKSTRISWLGHVMRMEDDRMPKTILRGITDGQRRNRRPRTRWLQDVENDLRRMGTGDWRRLVGETKIHRPHSARGMNELCFIFHINFT